MNCITTSDRRTVNIYSYYLFIVILPNKIQKEAPLEREGFHFFVAFLSGNKWINIIIVSIDSIKEDN